jgi:hypothetical protein
MTTSVDEESPTGPYIIDACTVIDYQKTEDWVLKLFSGNFGPVYIAGPVLDAEIRHFTSEDCKRLGITVAIPDLAQLVAAGRWPGPISGYDALTLVMAKDNRWTIISGDKALSRQAEIENVKCIRGLRPMIMLVSGGYLSSKRAIGVAEAMRTINPGFLNRDVMEDFREKIRRVTTLGKEFEHPPS